MKRLFFRKNAALEAASLLLHERKSFDLNQISKYSELELALQDDGRFSLWGNLEDDCDLLQDTRKDPKGLVQQVEALADEILTDDEPLENGDTN